MPFENSMHFIHMIQFFIKNNQYQKCLNYIKKNKLNLNIVFESLLDIRHYNLDNSDYSFFLKQIINYSNEDTFQSTFFRQYVILLINTYYFKLVSIIYWNSNLTKQDHINSMRNIIISMKNDVDSGYSIDWQEKQLFFEDILQKSKISFIDFVSIISNLSMFENFDIISLDCVFFEKMLFTYSKYEELEILS
jgi:hypothetical protein